MTNEKYVLVLTIEMSSLLERRLPIRGPWTTSMTLPYPGTEHLYRYWRIGLCLERYNTILQVYVPPEWRMLDPATLCLWTRVLCDYPYHDVRLGGVGYTWTNEIIHPLWIRAESLPLPGENGWPVPNEVLTLWPIPGAEIRHPPMNFPGGTMGYETEEENEGTANQPPHFP